MKSAKAESMIPSKLVETGMALALVHVRLPEPAFQVKVLEGVSGVVLHKFTSFTKHRKTLSFRDRCVYNKKSASLILV